jgi:predicted Zn-dependent peptidase
VILSNIIGGGVSSRLFQKLREERGLVYSIYTHTSFWKDTGGFWTFFTVDPRRLPLATEIFHEEIRRVVIEGVDEKELDSAKAQLVGSVVIGIESANNRLFRMFHSEYYHGRYISPAEMIRCIGRVSRTSVIEAARRYLDTEKLTYAACGPVTLRGLVPGRGSDPDNLRSVRGRRR